MMLVAHLGQSITRKTRSLLRCKRKIKIRLQVVCAQSGPLVTRPTQLLKVQRPESISAPLITTYIKRSSSVVELQKVVDAHGPTFNAIHISASLIHLVNVSHTSSMNLHESRNASMHIKGTQASEKQDMTCSMTEALLLKLLRMVLPSLKDFDIQGLSNVMYAMAKMSHNETHLLESVLTAAQYQLDMGKPQNLSNILWSCACLAHVPDREWMALFYDAFDATIIQFNPQDISNTFWAFAKLEDASMMKGHATASTSTSNTARHVFKVPVSVLTKLVNRARPQLPSFLPKQLTNSLWALAKLGVAVPSSWMQQFAAASLLRLRQQKFSPQELSQLIGAVSKLRVQMGKEWMEAFLTATHESLSLMSAEHISQILLALGNLKAAPSVNWTLTFTTTATSLLPTFTCQELANAMLGLSRLWVEDNVKASTHMSMLKDRSEPINSKSPSSDVSDDAQCHPASKSFSEPALHEHLLTRTARAATGSNAPLEELSTSEVTSLPQHELFTPWLEAVQSRLPDAETSISWLDISGKTQAKPVDGGTKPKDVPIEHSQSSASASSGTLHMNSQEVGPSRSAAPLQLILDKTFKAQELSNIMFATASLKLKPPKEWVSCVLGTLHGMMREVAAVPRQSAMLAWALRETGTIPSRLWIQAFEEATEPRRLRNVGSLELSSLLLAFASWKHIPSLRWQVRFWWQSGKLLHEGKMPPQHLVPLLSALCTLKLKPSPVWSQNCCKAMTADMGSFLAPPKLSPLNTVSSKTLTRLSHTADSEQPQISTDSSLPRLYTSTQLSSAARCLVVLGVAPGPEWTNMFLLACYECWHMFQPKEWEDTLWSLAHIQAEVPGEWLQRLAASSFRNLKAFNSRQLVTMLWSFSSLGKIQGQELKHSARSNSLNRGLYTFPPEDWLCAYFSATLPLLKEMSDLQLCRLLTSILRLGACPNRPWVLALVSSLRERKLSSGQEASLLRVLEKLLVRLAERYGDYAPNK
ncbi:hypothetical protein CEUSTIGMA_g754.t1 [Chlamydomonas eustigma]|uniref:FAST kinase leucine-rich domain-containing protein n=1 Tax=Chlamydomonas eustigma TaxID=1157962 RepID=A0A250WRY0_9CHLO|nr:hypothetical protein CEUSTIGMA_g754.t1 [Chlamydomonas eustigma]|eukprot:GAX73300.1 hypothetical protein CEUSTIGMA_g754.t1 [Chlamydomonas eustigma]